MTVLGSCGAWPEPGRACSGFVLDHAGFRVVMDLGYGTLSRLLEVLGSPVADGVDAVIVTHHHPDHMLDLHGLFRARWFGRRGSARIPLYAPEGVMARLYGLEEDDVDAIRQIFHWHPLPADSYDVGPWHLASVPLPHFVPNAGVRLSTDGGLIVAYTGDTGPTAALADLGRDADLFIVEASDRDQQPGTPPAPPGPRRHLTARDAGAAASAAAARRLMLFHFWPGNDREASRGSAQEAYDGDILIATEGLEVPLP